MNELVRFLETSYTPYQAVENARALLTQHGFLELSECAPWELAPNGRYFVVRGGSALIAFTAGDMKRGVKIVASHTDSPCFKLKERPALAGEGGVRLNAEPYGGGIWHTFFDRPLRIAGRIVEEDAEGLAARSYVSEGLVSIPSLAIHLDRTVNDAFSPKLQTDLPLFTIEAGGDLPANGDLYAACAEKPYFWGAHGELLSAPRLDDLASVYASLRTLARTKTQGCCIAACFDGEEVGSRTRQGAAGDFLRTVLLRIAAAQRLSQEEIFTAAAASFCISLDNAQGFHPNHPEKYDPAEKAYLGKGAALKAHAGGAYTTDALSAAVVKAVFAQAGAPLQTFYNRADMRSGSTLGAISLGQASILTADIGIPQLAMHSAVETIACADFVALEAGLGAYWRSMICMQGDRARVALDA